MKTFLRARTLAPKKNDHLHAPLTGRHGAPQAGTWEKQHGNGGAVRYIDRTPVAEIHGGGCEQQPGYGHAHAFLRDGSPGTRRGDDRTNLEQDARRGRDDRAGQRVIPRGTLAAAIPNTLTQSADPFDIVPSAWRNGRPAKSATTITPDLFELAGIRAAEHWLENRPTANPSQWHRATFENLVAGLGRIPAYAECCAASERAFKRRIEAAARTDREAAEVRA